jgi:hypothetical protein
VILALGITFGYSIESSYAQTNSSETSEQTTLSGDLTNNPFAQDILEKIEQTKQWIADLEKREYEKTKAQLELEEKRAVALERLNQDLLEWENLWANYTSRAAFERFVEDKPTQIQGVFWDQFEFKEMKVNAGRAALKEVIANGGTLSEARTAYHKAAETKRIELIEMNAQFNVKHNLAYYKEQLLFNSTGQLPLTPYAVSTLGEFYKDYRTNPDYLKSNPNDKHAYESLETSPDTNCRPGYVVVHRITSNDYACITESTAEMWERHGIGKVVDTQAVIYDENSLTPKVPTNPGTQCIDRHVVVYHFEAKAYGCILESVATTWIQDGIAEVHDLTEFILEKDKHKEVENQVFEINQEILNMYDRYILDQIELKKKYDLMYKEADELAKEEEKKLLEKFQSSDDMSKDELSNHIIQVRSTNDSDKEQILEDKAKALENLGKELDGKFTRMANQLDPDLGIKILWNLETSKYHAVEK